MQFWSTEARGLSCKANKLSVMSYSRALNALLCEQISEVLWTCLQFLFFLFFFFRLHWKSDIETQSENWMDVRYFIFIYNFFQEYGDCLCVAPQNHTHFVFFLSLLVKTFIGWPLYMLHPNLNLHFTLKWTLLNHVNLYIAANNISLVCLLRAVSASWNNWLIKNSVGSINEDIIYLHS